MSEEESPYKAYKNKVEFISKDDLPRISMEVLNEYVFDMKIVIEIIEIDLEWKDESPEWRQKAINALKSYKIALLYAKRELEGRG